MEGKWGNWLVLGGGLIGMFDANGVSEVRRPGRSTGYRAIKPGPWSGLQMVPGLTCYTVPLNGQGTRNQQADGADDNLPAGANAEGGEGETQWVQPMLT